MIGKPKYKYGDDVQFNLTHEGTTFTLTGKVEIIDAYGTFEDNSDVSYDIFVEECPTDIIKGPCLFKHIKETNVKPAC